ncbi:Uu.00g048280.m01.CDS01 [Anthostomella pinea]|uniref:Uu.00g048280.m01.CDS01 n=1 Tax=Anthostomella pinea TaxID=933095 RepID=A0AAI8YEN6_9PEZI|nr:Uu.00g048280.m01.CDS01 [Anthostomella pinea]
MLSSKYSGYATFSEFIASDPELSIYRSFVALSSRSLLYQQSELLLLEHKLKELDDADTKSSADLDVLLSAKCWETFAAKAAAGKPHELKRMETIKELQTKLKDYHETLLLQKHVLGLPKPQKRAFGAFQGLFDDERPFVGYGHDLLKPEGDFVALQPSSDQDFLTGARHETTEEIKYYSAKRVSRLATILTVVLASLLINGAIVLLYVVADQHVRLGMVAIFTNLFGATLAVLTDGKRTDIILATAACAAVMVVFVSSS